MTASSTAGAAMILYPAIDLKQGRCVRLERGDMSRATVFDADPVQQARTFAAQGFSWLHVVDLDGAVAGRPVNHGVVAAIVDAVAIPVQLGGGIRTMEQLTHWLEAGVRRAVLGTAAVQEPDLVRAAAARFPGRVAVALDARAGRVAVAGWTAAAAWTVQELARSLEDAGLAAFVHTDIGRDGMMSGLNVAASTALARACATPVIASGGLAGLADVRAARDAGLAGAIAGRALYNGGLDPAAALALLRAPPSAPPSDERPC